MVFDFNILINDIITNLKNIDIYALKGINNEDDFERYVSERLEKVINKRSELYNQCKSYKEGREIRPDIIIGDSQILIELKYDLKGVNDIYRLYYQAIKYSRIAKHILILCIHDPHKKYLLKSDISDLESVDKVKVVHVY